jgi:hypothetical protein
MSIVLQFRSADQQCQEYVEKQRARQKRLLADRVLAAHLGKMSTQFGALVTLGAVMRYVGVLLVEAAEKPVMIECRRYLVRKIVRSIVARVLTRRPMLH